MPSDLAKLEIQRDEDGRLLGFQVGRSAALLDWEHKREQKEFRRICKNLMIRRWRRTTEKGRAYMLRQTAKKRELRAQQRNSLAVITCCGCGSEILVSVLPGRKPKWCSRQCKARSQYRRKRDPTRGRCCSACGEPGHNIRTCQSNQMPKVRL